MIAFFYNKAGQCEWAMSGRGAGGFVSYLAAIPPGFYPRGCRLFFGAVMRQLNAIYGDLEYGDQRKTHAMVADFAARFEIRHFLLPLKLVCDLAGPPQIYAVMKVLDRTTGQPADIRMGLNFQTIAHFLNAGDEEHAKEVIMWGLRDFVTHEFLECLYFNGERKWDPHK